MKFFSLLFVAICACAMGAELSLGKIVDNVVKRPSTPIHPDLPLLPQKVRSLAETEIAADPSVKGAMSLLSVDRSNTEWFKGVETLRQKRSVWCLQSALCHPHEDVQLRSLRALREIRDPRAVRFLIVYADKMAVGVLGTEPATIHIMIIREVSTTLSALTGVKFNLLEGQDTVGLQRGIKLCVDWLEKNERNAGQ